MATSALVHTVMAWRTLARGARSLWRSRTGAGADGAAEAAGEIPRRWFWAGLLSLSAGTVALAHLAFGIPLAHGLLAVALSFVLAAVACRATGETDGTPMLGQITQITFGALLPRNPVANLMTASITGNSSAVAADLLTDLKAGQLLGANPRKQLVAQLIGCAVGSAAMVPFFYLLVPDASAIGDERFPAPAARLVLGVAQLMASGVDGLSAPARWAVGAGALAALLLTLAERLLPARWARWVPSPMGLGLGFLVPVSLTLGIFAGAAGMALLRRARPERAELSGPPLASGLIAGESVMAVLAAVLSPWRG
jgi:OPT family oligopeptide transporter